MLRLTRLSGLGLDLPSTDLSKMSPEQMVTWEGCNLPSAIRDAWGGNISKECRDAAAVLAISKATGLDEETARTAVACVEAGDPEACAKSAAVAGATYGCVAGVSAVGLPVAAPLCGTIAGEVVGFLWEPMKDLGEAAGKGLVAAMHWVVPDSIEAKGVACHTCFGDEPAAKVARLYQTAIERVRLAAESEQARRKITFPDFDAEQYLLARMPEDWFKAWTISCPVTDMSGRSPSWSPVGGAKGNGWWNAPLLEGVWKGNRWIAIPEGAPFRDEAQGRYNYGYGRWPGKEPGAYQGFVDALSKLYTEKRIKPLEEALSRTLQDMTGHVALNTFNRPVTAMKPAVGRAISVAKLLTNKPATLTISPSATASMAKAASRLISSKKVKPPVRRVLPANDQGGLSTKAKWGLGAAGAIALLGGIWYVTRNP